MPTLDKKIKFLDIVGKTTNLIMNVDEFLNLSYRQLEKITNIDKSNWSKYFNNKLSPRWKTINDAAKDLGMKPTELMIAIERKREETLKKIPA